MTGRRTVVIAKPELEPKRHPALHDLISWSYDLCTEKEQLLWTCCGAIFAGTFDLDTAEHVTGDDGVPAAEVFEVLDSWWTNRSCCAWRTR